MPDWADREYQPDFDADEQAKAAEPRHQLARELARRLHKEFRAKSPPVDVDLIVRERGLTLIKVDLRSRLSGALYAEQREVVVNTRNRSEARQRFTIAHELGHWELRHHEMGAIPEDALGFAGAYDDTGDPEPRSAIEIEANTFSAELLMPTSWIRKVSKPLADGAPQRLADQYGVSLEAMFYQLMRCGRF
jgi:Zn-dependent peptidase ImmA (M78 family)